MAYLMKCNNLGRLISESALAVVDESCCGTACRILGELRGSTKQETNLRLVCEFHDRASRIWREERHRYYHNKRASTMHSQLLGAQILKTHAKAEVGSQASVPTGSICGTSVLSSRGSKHGLSKGWGYGMGPASLLSKYLVHLSRG